MYLGTNATSWLREVGIQSLLPKLQKGFYQVGYESNTKAYRVFNKYSSLVEVTSDIVFDETNGFPREKVDLDDIDEDEVLIAVMRTMAIGDVRPHYKNTPLLQHIYALLEVEISVAKTYTNA